jgi:hypothetical protein
MSALPQSNAAAALSPVEAAALLTALVDELIPGSADWPAASAIGVQGLLAARVFEEWGEAELQAIVDAIVAAGGPFAALPAGERTAVVERFEAAQPERFERLRTAATLAYYESPFVAEAIRRMGRPYSLRPHLTGYPMRPFDPARDTPTHGRGRYLKTEEVRPVDVSALDLASGRTQNWGLKR